MDSIKTIIGRVALYCSTMSNIKPIDFLSLIIVELLDNIKSFNVAKDCQDFNKLIILVNNLSKVSGYQKFTKESLLIITKYTILDNYTLEYLSKAVGKCQFFEFPDTLDGYMSFKSVSKNPPKLRDNYGNKAYIPSTDISCSNSQNEYKSFPKWDKWDKLQTDNKDKKYFWQWRICKNDYESLKSFLKNTLENLAKDDLLEYYSSQISLFCAEWYKREYCGNGMGKQPAFRAINCAHDNIARDLCKNSGITLRGENRYVNSLYAQGGLPWKYIISDEDNNLSRCIGQVFKQTNNQKNSSEHIAHSIKNSTIRESYINEGSIYENINILLEDNSYEEYILSEFPNHNENIKNFIRGLKKEVFRYFSIIWRLDLRSDITLVSMLSFSDRAKFGCIPKELLEKYNIETDKCNKFNLVIKSGDNHIKFWTYYKCANGDYSTSEHYDARIITKYTDTENLPTYYTLHIEDIPGAFGIWGDNGFPDERSISIDKFEDLNIIKIYGDFNDKVLYSTPKDCPLYILKRDCITTKSKLDNICIKNLGNFDFFHIDKPVILNVNGRDQQFSPYGRLNIILNSKSLLNTIDLIKSEVLNNEITVNVRFDGKDENALLVSHNDLEDIQFSLGDMFFEENDCKIKYLDIEGNTIVDIKNHYGYTHLYVEYITKKVDINLYILDASRDIENNNIIINKEEHHIEYNDQPDSSQEFEIGDDKSGLIKINIIYPFAISDTILIYPERKVWTLKKYLEPLKEFYVQRTFEENGYNESQLIINNTENFLCPHRPTLTRNSDNPQIYKLEIAASNEKFYIYDTEDNETYELNHTNSETLVIPDMYDNTNYRYIVFQSLKGYSIDSIDNIYKMQKVYKEYNSKWWQVVSEHNLFIEDWFLLDSSKISEALAGYYEYSQQNPNLTFLRKLASTLRFNWLLIIKWLNDNLDNPILNFIKEHLKEMCELSEKENVAKFIDDYVKNITSVCLVDNRNRNTSASIAYKIAMILAGINNFWQIESEDQQKMLISLKDCKTYEKINKYLKFK